MPKNITLSADERLIRKARKKAQREHTTLNAQFRQWLEKYIGMGMNSNDYRNLMKRLSYAEPTKRYSREELNER